MSETGSARNFTIPRRNFLCVGRAVHTTSYEFEWYFPSCWWSSSEKAVMSNPAQCSWQCIASIIGVGLLWGVTNPLLRLGSKAGMQSTNASGVQASSLPLWQRLFAPFIDLTLVLMNWRFSVPFLVNQSASVLFVMLVSRYPVSIIVPCVNALQFVFTAVAGHFLGERILSGKSCIGAVTVIVGILVMMTSDALDSLDQQ